MRSSAKLRRLQRWKAFGWARSCEAASCSARIRGNLSSEEGLRLSSGNLLLHTFSYIPLRTQHIFLSSIPATPAIRGIIRATLR